MGENKEEQKITRREALKTIGAGAIGGVGAGLLK
jgi:hypothetical protein